MDELEALRAEVAFLRRILVGKCPPAERGSIPRSLREYVIERSGGQCQYCGQFGSATMDGEGNSWHIDHVVPVIHGGPTHADNLTLCCQACNSQKGPLAPYLFIRQKWARENPMARFVLDPAAGRRISKFSECWLIVILCRRADERRPLVKTVRVVSFARETAIRIAQEGLELRGIGLEQQRVLSIHHEDWILTLYDRATRLPLLLSDK